MAKLSIRDVDLQNKTVFMRVDFNVPLEPGTLKITSDKRIKASLPSIQYALEHGAALILASHLGRPKGKPVSEMSLAPVAVRLQELLPGVKVTMAPDCVIEYVSDGTRFEGRDAGVKAYFEQRNRNVLKSWHGNFTHTADAANARVATRFAVRRTDRGAAERSGDNINLFQFDGRLITRIAVWRGVQSR